MDESFDYIVVGGGSAGCVVVNRLVEAGKSVLLLEDGPTDNHPFVRMPGAFVRLIGTKRTHLYRAAASDNTAGREMVVPQGRMLGGGSSINAMIYIRGQAKDYDNWAAQGCVGWGWADVLPVFRRAERNESLAGPYHGTDGLLRVSDPRYRHPLSKAFVLAAQQAGLAHSADFNGTTQEGAGFYQTTTMGGARGSTAATYLSEVKGCPSLKVLTGTRVNRVTLENGVVRGVEARIGDKVQSFGAHHEVILTAGALATPKILLLSGIGPAGHLQSHGVTVIRDLPGVGQNFQDHLEVPVLGRTRDPISLLGQDRGLRALAHGLQYKFFRSGLLASTVVESGGFTDTDGDGRPDIQFHVLPVLVGDAERAPLEGHGLSINPCFLRPRSRGEVGLSAPDPDAPIRFRGGYLSAVEDVQGLMRGTRLARRILRQPALQKLVSAELLPAAEDDISDALLEAHVRGFAKTVYHPAGTCRMGNDVGAVVDSQLRVRGVPGLRVCDASIMPNIVSGNTNAPVIMIAERCADFILGR